MSSISDLCAGDAFALMYCLAILDVFFQDEVDVLAEVAVIGLRQIADVPDHVLVEGDADFGFEGFLCVHGFIISLEICNKR